MTAKEQELQRQADNNNNNNDTNRSRFDLLISMAKEKGFEI